MAIWRTERGFTLSELLIVVVILGVIATIAIPTYLNFRQRALRAEVQSNLAGTFQAEIVFFGEQQRYGSFSEIGFQIAGLTNRFTYRSPALGGAAGSGGTANVDVFNPSVGAASAENSVAASAAQVAGPGVTPAFTATATANLDNDTTLDQWHVNHDKQDLQNADVDDVLL